MKLKTKQTLSALAAAALVSVLGVLFIQTRSINFDAQNQILSNLRQVKQIDAQWNVDVLRSKTGLSTNYDRVASPLALIDSLKAALQTETVSLWGDHAESKARLSALLSDFTSLMDKKTEEIETFKSQNAILRNSSRFLPLAATDLAQTTRLSNASNAVKSQIERDLNNLLADTMLYTIATDAALRDRIEEGTRKLAELTLPLSPEVRERSETLIAHATTVLKQQDVGSKVLAELNSLPTAKAVDDLSDAYAKESEQMVATQQLYSQALIGYSVFLLLLLAYAGSRIRRSYTLLDKANDTLKKTNAELKESHVQLVQSEKMSALGQMVAGIAHEINTPLAYVKGTFSVLKHQLTPIKQLASSTDGFTHLLRAPKRDNEALNHQLREVEANVTDVLEHGVLEEMETLLKDGIHGIEQISEIVLNLKNFSRLDRAKVADFSVEEGINSTLMLAKNIIKDKVTIVKEFGGVPQISGSPSQINQVLLNIITNAAQAMPQREEMNVITLRTSLENEHTVRIEIQDNGSGISKDVLPKIFDPFFTTKAIGQGTGMGLSISYKIIQEHGGQMLVDSEPGVGTVFTILLPIQAAQASSGAVVADDEDVLFAA